MIMDPFTDKMLKLKSNPKDYMESLEEERKKIQVFHRELPLCLQLVNEAIENCKKQSVINEGPILEEFLPLKGIITTTTTSSSFVEENDEETKTNDENLEKKTDWLKSAQLWNQNPEQPSIIEVKKLPPQKCSKIELKKSNGGAFQPFQIELKGTPSTITTTTTESTVAKTPLAATTSSNMSAVKMDSTSSTNGDTVNNATKRKREERESELRRKTRRCWSQELHKRFLDALQQLGGSNVATPKQIKELMKVDGLTNDEVKSHLQKFRIHTRGSNQPTTATHSDSNPQPPQFVVVGGIWVPPPDYAKMVETKEGNARITSGGVYIPVAAPPPPRPPQHAVKSCSQQQQQLQQSPTGSLHSEGRSNQVERNPDIHSHSWTPSSSTETM